MWLLCVLEENLDAQDAVRAQVIGNVVDLDVLREEELLAQLTARHLFACDTERGLVLSRYFQQLTVYIHLCRQHVTHIAAYMHVTSCYVVNLLISNRMNITL